MCGIVALKTTVFSCYQILINPIPDEYLKAPNPHIVA